MRKVLLASTALLLWVQSQQWQLISPFLVQQNWYWTWVIQQQLMITAFASEGDGTSSFQTQLIQASQHQ